ncbi:unnamed protein product [Leuciscus chuanchicus]
MRAGFVLKSQGGCGDQAWPQQAHSDPPGALQPERAFPTARYAKTSAASFQIPLAIYKEAKFLHFFQDTQSINKTSSPPLCSPLHKRPPKSEQPVSKAASLVAQWNAGRDRRTEVEKKRKSPITARQGSLVKI